jgi:hypothetical protein
MHVDYSRNVYTACFMFKICYPYMIYWYLDDVLSLDNPRSKLIYILYASVLVKLKLQTTVASRSISYLFYIYFLCETVLK